MIQLPLTGIPVAVRIGDTVMRNGEYISSIIKIYSQEGEKYLVDVFAIVRSFYQFFTGSCAIFGGLEG